MSGLDNYMDESFKKMSEDIRATYHASFWDDALAQLENDSLDDAFRNAAAQIPVFAELETVIGGLDDAFMDDAFREGAQQLTTSYDSSLWEGLEQVRPDLEMDAAFSEAANEVVANYSPLFWGDANSALESEGLHFEYQAQYWNEARVLLDKADRSVFFTKWTAVALVLLLISFAGLNTNFDLNLARESHSKVELNKTDLVLASDAELINEKHVELTNDPLQSNLEQESALNTNQEQRQVQSNHLQKNGAVNFLDQPLSDQEIDPSTVDAGLIVEGDEVNPQTEIRPEELELPIDVSSLGLHELAAIEPHQTEERFGINNALNELTNASVLHLPLGDARISLKTDAPVFSTNSSVDLTAQRLKPLHTIALVGNVGLGQNYGPNTYFFTKRYGGGFEYCFAGSGRNKNGNFNRFEFGAGIGVNYVQADGLGIENQVTLFKANGETEKYWRNLQIFDLYYGNLNVFTNYRVTARHKFRFGLGIDRLLAVQSNMAFRMDDDKGIQTINNNWGVQDGISRYDFKLSLGYDFVVNQNWTFQLNFNSGLINRTDNVFFNDQTKQNLERNLTVGLRYTIFNKL